MAKKSAGPFETIGRAFGAIGTILDITDDGLQGVREYSKGFANQAKEDNERTLKRSILQGELEDLELEEELSELKAVIASKKLDSKSK